MITGRLLTLAEAAELLEVAPRTVLRWVTAGVLAHHVTDARGRRLYLDRDLYDARRRKRPSE